jgi:catechol 2,3-dioxygenase-like lactoylglutathione lyase family enzyme
LNLKLEAISISVSDVDRAKKFSREALGFRVDVDHRAAVYEEALGFRHRGAATRRPVLSTRTPAVVRMTSNILSNAGRLRRDGWMYAYRCSAHTRLLQFYFAPLGVNASTNERNGPEVLPRCQATKTSQVASVSAMGTITTLGIFR